MRGIVHVIGLVFAVYAWVYVYDTLFEIRLIGLGHTRIFLPNSPSASVVFASILSFPPLEHRSLKHPWTPRNVSLHLGLHLDDSVIRDCCLIFSSLTVSDSDIGSSASNFRGPMSSYSGSYPRGYHGSYGAPSTVMSQPYYSYTPSYTPSAAYSNYSYAPSAAYSGYSNYSTSGYNNTGNPSEQTYFSLDGKLVRSYKVRSYRVGLWASLPSTTL